MSHETFNIFDSVVSNNLTEITADVLEAGIDQLIDNDFLKDIPILGIGIKAYSITRKISESFFAKKIMRFLFQLKDIPQEKREAFVKTLETSKENKKAGETVLGIINRLDEISKASIIGRLLKATILQQLSYPDFLRLSHITDKIFLDDLLSLKNNPSLYNITRDVKAILYQSGLLMQEVKDNRDFEKYVRENTGGKASYPPTFEYKLNDFGRKLIRFGL